MLVFAVVVGVALFSACPVGGCGEPQAPGVVCHDIASVVQFDALWVLHVRQDDEACLRSAVAP